MPLKNLCPALGCTILLAGCGTQLSEQALSPAAPTLAPRQISPKTAPTFVSKAQEFAIWLPVKPTETLKSRDLGKGETVTMHIFQAPTATVNYAILATATPPGVDMSDPALQLDVIEKGMLATVTAKSPGANVQK